MVLTDNGFVVIEAAPGRVVHIDADGNRKVLATFLAGTEALPIFPPSNIFDGIAADADGDLFITGQASRALYRIEAPY